jgi:hypothetical protein
MEKKPGGPIFYVKLGEFPIHSCPVRPISAKMYLTTKPMAPRTTAPNRHTLKSSQNSVLPGFVAERRSLVADVNHDLTPIKLLSPRCL